MTAPGVPTMAVGYDRCVWDLRIGLRSASAEGSGEWASLQLADVLAGTATRYVRWLMFGQDPGDAFGVALSGIYLPHPSFPDLVVWPSPDVTPEALDATGPNAAPPLDAMAAVIRGARVDGA